MSGFSKYVQGIIGMMDPNAEAHARRKLQLGLTSVFNARRQWAAPELSL